MPASLYMDVYVPQAITEQLRRRGVDVLTAIDDGMAEATDERLLDRAGEIVRVLFTQDIRFKSLAEEWQRRGRPFAGLLFGHQLGGTIGDFVRDLELVALASVPDDWRNVVDHLPFRTGR